MSVPKPSFDSMGLQPWLLENVANYGLECPSVLQEEVVPAIIAGRNVVCQAWSSFGKTTALSIACLQCIDYNMQRTQVIIVVADRIGAYRIQETLTDIARKANIAIGCYLGKTSVAGNILEIRKCTPYIVIGTPGRLTYLIAQKGIACDSVKTVFLYEAEELLDLNFQDQMSDLIQKMQNKCYLVAFSLPLADDKLYTAERIIPNALYFDYSRYETIPSTIRQYKVELNEEWKVETILDIFQVMSVQQAIIFTNSHQVACDVFAKLKKRALRAT